VETAAPAPARTYPAVPVHAAGVAMLPDSWDVEDRDVEFEPWHLHHQASGTS
jgi:hypothetical protein